MLSPGAAGKNQGKGNRPRPPLVFQFAKRKTPLVLEREENFEENLPRSPGARVENLKRSRSERGRIVEEFCQQWMVHQDRLYRCCLKLMNFNPTDAEDALSQAMLKAVEKVQQFAGKIANFKAWLMRLTSNLCIDIIRERSRWAVGFESIESVADTEEMGEMGTAFSVKSPESVLEREEKSAEIRRAIASLPKRMRETFIWHFYEELTHRSIIERQGISYDNVCKRISLARKKLKQMLSGYFRESESEVISCCIN